MKYIIFSIAFLAFSTLGQATYTPDVNSIFYPELRVLERWRPNVFGDCEDIAKPLFSELRHRTADYLESYPGSADLMASAAKTVVSPYELLGRLRLSANFIDLLRNVDPSKHGTAQDITWIGFEFDQMKFTAGHDSAAGDYIDNINKAFSRSSNDENGPEKEELLALVSKLPAYKSSVQIPLKIYLKGSSGQVPVINATLIYQYRQTVEFSEPYMFSSYAEVFFETEEKKKLFVHIEQLPTAKTTWGDSAEQIGLAKLFNVLAKIIDLQIIGLKNFETLRRYREDKYTKIMNYRDCFVDQELADLF